ncbi:MAG TPA: VPLPA-CTERM sorting domain-containing protein [Amaricoccus sp.]|nr:VPLPA-CTERM sorting domain-containing protein [Amaricoccus sp.]
MQAFAAALFVMAGVVASPASAATLIDFSGDKKADPYVQDGFSFAPARIVNGNCLGNGCLALNDNETTGLSYLGTPGLFTLSGLSFNLLGNGNGTGNALTVTGSNGTSLSYAVDDFAKNSYHTLFFGDAFADVSSILFSTSGRGNVRIDDLTATPSPAPVPLPAAAWLLIGGLGTLAAIRRRRPA